MAMNRSLMIIFVMGLIATVMLSIFGSFFVGKVGGAEHITSLKAQLRDIYGVNMKDPKALTVKVTKVGEESGILVEYEPVDRLTKNDRKLEFHMQRVSGFVLGSRRLRKHTHFVVLRLHLPNGQTREERYDRHTESKSF
jgi:hypothetical protein